MTCANCARAWVDVSLGHMPRRVRALLALPALWQLVDKAQGNPMRFHATVLHDGQVVRWSIEVERGQMSGGRC